MKNIKMKIKTGFISNSSSCSFIVPRAKFKNIFNVAKKMIPLRDYGKEKDVKLIQKIKDAEGVGMDPNTPITFPSCNYDTFILPSKKYFLIMTCNNHPFGDVFSHFNILDIPDEIKKLVKYNELEDTTYEDLYYKKYGHQYWDPYYDMIIESLDYLAEQNRRYQLPKKYSGGWCAEHYCDIVRIVEIDKNVCPQCYRDKYPNKVLTKIIQINPIASRFELLDIR